MDGRGAQGAAAAADAAAAAAFASTPNFNTMQQELGVMDVKLKSQPDGSGVGAAVTAAAYAL